MEATKFITAVILLNKLFYALHLKHFYFYPYSLQGLCNLKLNYPFIHLSPTKAEMYANFELERWFNWNCFPLQQQCDVSYIIFRHSIHWTLIREEKHVSSLSTM